MAGAAIVALLLSCIVLWSRALPLSPPLALVLLLSAVVGVGVLAAIRARCRGLPIGPGWRRPVMLVLLAGLPVVATIDAASRQLANRLPETLIEDQVLTGSVCNFPRQRPGSWQFLLQVDQRGTGRRPAGSVPDNILVTWYAGSDQPPAGPEPGQRWQLKLRLRPPRGLGNPGGFDYERWLFSQRIGATAWVRPDAGNGRLTGEPACRLAGVRADLARRISAAVGERPAAAYVLGLSIGAYQALPEVEWDKLRRTGTIHLISISGFHIALLAIPAALFGWSIGAAMLAVGKRCRPRVIAAATAFLAAAAYGGLAGFSVPTARSVIAVGVVALLTSRRRAITGPGLLAAVLLAVLLIEPLAPLVPGFWLSFAGVIVLVAAGMLSMHRGVQGHLRTLVLTQLCMTIGLAPLTILWFGQLPLAGALANLVAVPAFSLILLPLTLLGTVAVVLAPAIGGALLRLAADGFDLWRQFVEWCAGLPGAVWYFPAPGPLAAWLALAGVVLLLWPRPWPARWLAPWLLTGLLAPGIDPVPERGLRVTVLDVGQGLAVLVQTAGHALLYDSGPQYRHSDAGERVAVPALQAANVRRLDALMISHADADHRGGAASVLARYPRAVLLGADVPPQTARPCRAGDQWWWDGVRFEVLSPRGTPADRSDNESSCVLRVTAGATRVLLPGDIEAATEEQLVGRGEPGTVDLVLAPHHGSRTSSTAGLVQATRPRHVVFSTGYRNRWHFPAAEVVERWHASGACLLDTADQGSLQFDTLATGGLQLTGRWRADSQGIWLARPVERCIVTPDRRR